MKIRPLTTDNELKQCVDLQREIWGADFDDIVPPSILKVAQKIGGVAAGAFDERGEMLGFVFGMAGVREGKIIHWSDMLAVRAASRDSGVGRRLKEFQRQAARAAGATTMYWTYDPLVARNAHLNFNRLGTTVDEYIEDMYGASESDLHRGFGTDRFVVAWPLDREPDRGPEPTEAERSAPVINGEMVDGRSALAVTGGGELRVARVAIPSDIVKVRDESTERAAQWRASTRAAFRWALHHGWRPVRVYADPGRALSYYVLRKS
ncbi:MAG TPA: hypothetical protein VHM67_09235 [Gemmatimonadaceae bacterium]|nr:hypothetical protein [Gemmatimonadaceae bacterium]